MKIVIVCVPVLMCDPSHLEMVGSTEFSESIVNYTNHHLPSDAQLTVAPNTSDGLNQSIKVASLTPREREVLMHIANGQSYKKIARELGISPHTVSGYKKEIYRKLGINSAAEATQIAIKSKVAA